MPKLKIKFDYSIEQMKQLICSPFFSFDSAILLDKEIYNHTSFKPKQWKDKRLTFIYKETDDEFYWTICCQLENSFYFFDPEGLFCDHFDAYLFTERLKDTFHGKAFNFHICGSWFAFDKYKKTPVDAQDVTEYAMTGSVCVALAQCIMKTQGEKLLTGDELSLDFEGIRPWKRFLLVSKGHTLSHFNLNQKILSPDLKKLFSPFKQTVQSSTARDAALRRIRDKQNEILLSVLSPISLTVTASEEVDKSSGLLQATLAESSARELQLTKALQENEALQQQCDGIKQQLHQVEQQREEASSLLLTEKNVRLALELRLREAEVIYQENVSQQRAEVALQKQTISHLQERASDIQAQNADLKHDKQQLQDVVQQLLARITEQDEEIKRLQSDLRQNMEKESERLSQIAVVPSLNQQLTPLTPSSSTTQLVSLRPQPHSKIPRKDLSLVPRCQPKFFDSSNEPNAYTQRKSAVKSVSKTTAQPTLRVVHQVLKATADIDKATTQLGVKKYSLCSDLRKMQISYKDLMAIEEDSLAMLIPNSYDKTLNQLVRKKFDLSIIVRQQQEEKKRRVSAFEIDERPEDETKRPCVSPPPLGPSRSDDFLSLLEDLEDRDPDIVNFTASLFV